MSEITANYLVNALPMLYLSKKSIVVLGPPGIGKTQIFQNAWEHLSFKSPEEFPHITITCPDCDPMDTGGTVVPVKSEQGVKAIRTCPYILTKVFDTKSPKGVLILDEFTSAEYETQKTFASLLLERHVNGYKIPDGWMIVGTGNTMDDMTGANDMLPHIVNRVFLFNMIYDPNSLCSYVKNKIYDDSGRIKLQDFIIKASDNLMKEQDTTKPFFSPRSFCESLKFLLQMNDGDLYKASKKYSIFAPLLQARMGKMATESFNNYLSNFIKDNYDVKLKANRDTINLLVESIVEGKYLDDANDNYLTYCPEIIGVIMRNDNDFYSDDQVMNIVNFVYEHLSGELRQVYIKQFKTTLGEIAEERMKK